MSTPTQQENLPAEPSEDPTKSPALIEGSNSRLENEASEFEAHFGAGGRMVPSDIPPDMVRWARPRLGSLQRRRALRGVLPDLRYDCKSKEDVFMRPYRYRYCKLHKLLGLPGMTLNRIEELRWNVLNDINELYLAGIAWFPDIRTLTVAKPPGNFQLRPYIDKFSSEVTTRGQMLGRGFMIGMRDRVCQNVRRQFRVYAYLASTSRQATVEEKWPINLYLDPDVVADVLLAIPVADHASNGLIREVEKYSIDFGDLVIRKIRKQLRNLWRERALPADVVNIKVRDAILTVRSVIETMKRSGDWFTYYCTDQEADLRVLYMHLLVRLYAKHGTPVEEEQDLFALGNEPIADFYSKEDFPRVMDAYNKAKSTADRAKALRVTSTGPPPFEVEDATEPHQNNSNENNAFV